MSAENSFLTGPVQIAAQGVYEESSSALHRIGELAIANDGRAFRYCLAGGTALVPGSLQAGPAEDTTNYQGLTVTAPAAGATEVVTTSTPTVTANALAEGFLVIASATTGAGQTARIKSHAAAAAAALTLTLHDPIQTAPTGTVTVDAHPNPLNGVIVCPTTKTSCAVGVPLLAITAAYYGWLQCRGPVAVLADGANAVGAAVVPSNGTAGAVEDAASPGSQGRQVGSCITGAADTEHGLVDLSIA